MSHINTMLECNETLLKLNHVQIMLDLARSVNPMDQEVQLDMDRRQSELDQKRALIREMIADIANQN